MEPGVRLVKIAEIRYSRDSKGIIKKIGNNPLIDIIFENKEKKRIALNIVLSQSTQWIFDAICNAIELQADKEIDIEQLIGKKLYIVVGSEYLVHEGVRRKDATGVEIVYNKVILKFFSAKNEAPIINESQLIFEKETT